MRPKLFAFFNCPYRIHLMNWFIVEYMKDFKTYLRTDDWYLWVNMKTGSTTLPVFQSLEAFWPGILVRMHSANR